MRPSLYIPPMEEETSNQITTVNDKKKLLSKQIIVLGWELFLALPLGLLLSWFQLGGITWIFGGITSGVVVLQTYRLLYGQTPKPNRITRKIGLVLVGMTIGAANAHSNWMDIAADIPVFICLTIFLLLCGSLIGYIYSRLSQVNLLTAMLATTPGGVGVMAAIAADYNKNVPLVALVQAMRVTSVVFFIPIVARVFTSESIQTQPSSLTDGLFRLNLFQLELLVLALIFTAGVVYIATRLKIPAAPFFAALVTGMVFNPLLDSFSLGYEINFTPPVLVKVIGQILLGITIGEYWGEKPTLSKRTIYYAILSVLMTLAVGAIAATLAWYFTSWDWLTCLLVTAPGGSAEMILVALALDHDVKIITIGHLIRLIAINCSLPLWLYLFRRFEEQSDENHPVFGGVKRQEV
ncbi:AbrB family transcriptional regulator [Calothrix sp. 336/3]|uniref:AbrB family transcriptional regulator n=1 Tax=Calothrix sp. 336/3 TaxID=1337936 RepID=UPI000624C454|nr:AbrB family transcriptional regulator [Calothrix sp. 336/3]AKG23610.1 AbrB family transcriptional regulator [Calothrix sp. 336/3]